MPGLQDHLGLWRIAATDHWPVLTQKLLSPPAVVEGSQQYPEGGGTHSSRSTLSVIIYGLSITGSFWVCFKHKNTPNQKSDLQTRRQKLDFELLVAIQMLSNLKASLLAEKKFRKTFPDAWWIKTEWSAFSCLRSHNKEWALSVSKCFQKVAKN